VNPAGRSPAYNRPNLIKNSALAFSEPRALSGSVSCQLSPYPGLSSLKSPPLNALPEKKYSEAVNGTSTRRSRRSRESNREKSEPALECDFVFSALDSVVAGPAKKSLSRALFSCRQQLQKSSNVADVPLLIPEVNAAHLTRSLFSRKIALWLCFIVTSKLLHGRTCSVF